MQYRLAFSGTSVTFELFTTFQGSVLVPVINNKNVKDGIWHHVTVSWKNDLGLLTLYIDGEYNNEKPFAEKTTIPK